MPARPGWLRNAALVRALLSFGFAFTAEWAFTVALGLVAFADGGALAVGVVGLLRLLPAALLAPVITAYADRRPREHVLVASSLVRGTSTLAAAPVLAWGGPTWVVYALAVVSTVAFTPYRAGHSALMPSLCRTPEDLTSVNVVRGALDSVSVIVGPLVAAALVAVTGVAAVFVFAGLCALASAALVVRLRYERIPLPDRGQVQVAREVREGVAAVAARPDVGVVIGLVLLQAVIRGAFTVFVLVVALGLLDGSQSSAGVLQGAVGIGALVGSLSCTLLVGSRAMTRWLGLGVVLWGMPLLVMGLVPVYVVALAAAAVIGVGNALVDVTAFTLVARMVPNPLLARVYGLLESGGATAVALGALAAPLLIELLGSRMALAVVGAMPAVVCALGWRRLTRIDRTVSVRTDDIHLLRQVPMLRPLPVPVIEGLAAGLEHLAVAPGGTVFSAGDHGDSFYVIASGSVEVVDRERLVRTMGPGEGFGEIALLGDTTRTMTIRAAEQAQLAAIRRAVFLPALASTRESRSAAEATRRSHLRDAPGSSAGSPEIPE